MSRKLTPSLIAALALASAAPAVAVELGNAQVRSSLGEPFEARIDLLLAPSEAPAELAATVKADLRYRGDAPMRAEVQGLRAEVAAGPGGPHLRLRGAAPVSSPVLAFRIRVAHPGGAVVRGYELLVDPPVGAWRAATRASRPDASTPATAATSQARTQAAAGERYGPVAPGETLWGIARKLSREGGPSTAALVEQLHALNPAAFVGGDADRLRAGATLRMPAAAVASTEAAAETTADTAVAAPAASPAAAEPATASAPAADSAPARAEARATLARARAYVEAQKARLAAIEAQLQRAGESAASPGESASTTPAEAGATTPAGAAPARAPAAAPPRPAPAAASTAPSQSPASAAPEAAQPPTGGDWPLRQLLLAVLLLLLLATMSRAFVQRRSGRRLERAHAVAERARLAAVAEKANRAEASRNGERQGRDEAPAQTGPPPEEPGHLLVELEDDSVAEADINIAYGRYAEAEESLNDVLENAPENHLARLKLAELYYAARRPAQFQAVAEQLARQRPVLSDSDWQRLLGMGREIAPEHPLFGGPTLVHRREDGAA